ncbi:MAG: FAD-binding oxidoreductase [Rhodospirillaceae bacterium]|nr:FAD-binding oxidoreductase [Rhodospirillaceae bacterium]
MQSNDARLRPEAPSWYEASAIARPVTRPLEGDIEADVCIVGGGFTGLSTALNLAERGLKPVLIEAQRIGYGASGRNGGQINSGMRCGPTAMVEYFGADDAKRMWAMTEEAKAIVRERIQRHAIEAHWRPGTLYASLNKDYRREVDEAIETTRRHFNYDADRRVDRDEIRALLGSTIYEGGMIDMGAAHMHPLNYAIGLGHAAIAAGAVLHENTRATSIDEDGHGVATGRGRIRARHTIVACNGYLEKLVPQLAAKILPIRNYIIATEPLGEARAKTINRDDLAVHDNKFVVDYYRMTHDHRLTFGGGEVYGRNDPADIKRFVRPHMLKVYPQLADVRIEHGWGGWLALTMNRLPHLGRLSRDLYFAQGYSGQGVALSGLYGKLIAEAIAGTAGRFDLFAGIGHHDLPGGPLLRQPLQILGMLWYSLRDRL